jgi:hypothetical protein
VADFAYNPELLSQLQAQLRAANASGLPWLIESAQRAYDYAKASGADLPFDAKGEPDRRGTQPCRPCPQATADANAQTGRGDRRRRPGRVRPAAGAGTVIGGRAIPATSTSTG